MSFLRLSLDDPHAGVPCGVCSVCTGVLPAGLAFSPSESDVDAARIFARGIDVVIEPRKLWPTGSIDRRGAARKGRIGNVLVDGRALAFADDPGWADRVVALTDDRAPDGELPDDVAIGVVELLARWARQWPARPTAVVAIPSRTHPMLISSLAHHIAAVGRLNVIDALEWHGSRPVSGVASGQRVAAVTASLVPAAALPEGSLPVGPILLVDDVYSSGWTMTVAASLLEELGATAVYPLVLHRRP